MAKTWMSGITVLSLALACTEQPSDYRGRAGQAAPSSGELDVIETQTPDSGAPSADNTPKTTPTPTVTPSPAPLNEAQALALVRGSCIFAGCHADGAVLMQSPNILVQVKDSLMPPPNQQRYTLRPADRAALVTYLNNRNAAALK